MSFSRTLKEKSATTWEDCYRHPFVQQIGSGELSRDRFRFYLKQDYKYLLEYARIFALGAVRAADERTIASFTASQSSILRELDIHRGYMQSFGITPEDAQSAEPSLLNKAYTSFMTAVGYNEGLAELLAALLPCAWTYHDFARRLKEEYKDRLYGNCYKAWIEAYAADSFYSAYDWFFPTMDKLCAGKSEKELERIAGIFKTSVEFEYLFWDMAYKMQMSY